MVTNLILTMVCLVAGGSFHSGQYLESQILKVFFNESDTCWPNPCSFGETCIITNKDLPVCVKLERSDYLGCYKDDDSRHLKHNMTSSFHVSLAFCKQHCSGYRFCGMQVPFVCVANVLIESKYPKIPEAECDHDCNGEQGRKCGALEKFNLFSLKIPPLSRPPSSRPPLSSPPLSHLNYMTRVPVKIISEPSG
ncbi:unnamed protein product [Mytilus edulis]|uniref:WSC domain-containing protein n=1 Tax=Mytilus edulis TaxID=6550 RepID=A0A8S3ULE7_MYTED|nr:unnamed protein product [Mytilus edulis]